MNTIRSAAALAKPISWVTRSIVIPLLASLSITSRTSLIISGSRALVGSSKSITLGFIARARAIATRCCWPPESFGGCTLAFSSNPTSLSSSIASSWACFLESLRTFIGARVMFSKAVRWGKRLKDWKTIPTSSRIERISTSLAVTSSSSMKILPLVGSSSLLIERSNVDFPLPDGPMMTTTWPSSTVSEASTTAWTVLWSATW